MISALSSCCGQEKQVSFVEEARFACINANWDTMDYRQIKLLVSIIGGAYQQINGQAVLNSLFVNIEMGNVCKNAAFILKTLIIFDFVVEARLYLDILKKYYNEQLIYLASADPNTQPYAALIADFHLYIKQKAKLYELQKFQVSNRQTRQQFINNATQMQILNQINISLRIQNLILEINEKYKKGKKKNKIIQFIFSHLLKTYLACHSITTIAMKVFTSRIFTFSLYDLKQYIQRFIIYYKSQYTERLSKFINDNRQIQCFKNVPIHEIMINNRYEKIQQLLAYQIQNIQNDPGLCPQPQFIEGKTNIYIKMQTNEFERHQQSNTTTQQDVEKQKQQQINNKFSQIN